MSRVREAWRRLWRALALFWLWQLVAAFLLAAPVVAAFAGTGIARHPHADAVLFEPGGAMLIEALRLGAAALLSALRASSLVYVVLGLIGLVPLAALFVALDEDGRLRPSAWLGVALGHFPPFLLIAGVTWLARAVLAVLCIAAYAALEDPIASTFDERSADLVLLGAACFALTLFLLLGLAADLARAARIRHRVRAFRALSAGLAALARHPWAAALGWLIPASWSVAVIALAAIAVGALSVERPGAWRVIAAFVVHQLALLVLIGLRALWLRRSLELVEPLDQAVAPMV